MKYTIKLNSKKQTLSLKNRTQKISLRHTGKPGGKGDKGDKGDAGEGLPTGGLTGQIIVKTSNDDFDFGFASPSSLADKNYVQSFSVSSNVLVNHGLNKYPSVTVFDTAGDEVEGTVEHLSPTSLRLIFSAAFSGTVTCN